MAGLPLQVPASGGTGAYADNPHDAPSLLPAPYNPADYAPAGVDGPVAESPQITPEEAAIAPGLTHDFAEATRQPVDILAPGIPQDRVPGRTFESPATQSAPEGGGKPAKLDVLSSAFIQNNVVSSMYDRLTTEGLGLPFAVAGYDPTNDIHGFEQYWSRFVRSRSPEETQQIKNRIARETQMQDIISRDRVFGTTMSIASGFVDPISIGMMAIPVVPEIGIVSRGGKIAAGIGANVVLQSGQEAILHANQETRTLNDSLVTIGAGALLTGILGGMATRVPFKEFDAARRTLGEELAGRPQPPAASTAGAMHAGTTLEQETIARGGQTLAATAGRISPITRVMQAPVLEARQLGQQLVETAGYLNKNFEGLATQHSVEAVVKHASNKRNLAVIEDLDSAYGAYRKRMGDQPTMKLHEFGEAVTDAISNGAKSDIPEVAGLARNTAKVFTHDRRVMEELKMIDKNETDTVVGAEGYVPRVYDRAAIDADRAGLEKTLTQWYTDHPLGEAELASAREETQKLAAEVDRLKAEHANGVVDFYHGGANPLSEFNDLKINTGEGNQNFGHGHYAGTTPGVGLHYVPQIGGALMHGRTTQGVIDSMLNLDRQLKDQPKILEMLGVDPNAPVKLNGINPEWTGRELHDALVQGKTNVGVAGGATLLEKQRAAAEYLKSKGVTGTKYFDAISRKAGTGSRNLVFFHAKDAQILSHEKVPHLGERFGSGLPERLAKHAEETAAAKAASKEKWMQARAAHTEAKAAEKKARELTEFGREAPEIQSRVMATIDHIMGHTPGTADVGLHPAVPSVRKARVLTVPDKLLRPWLMRNYTDIMHGYHRATIPQIEMFRRFGGTTLENEIQSVVDAFHVKQAGAKTNAEKSALSAQQKETVDDLVKMRDRVLGQANAGSTTPQGLVRALAVVRAYNYVRLLGKQTLSSLSDYGRLVVHYGLPRTLSTTAKFLTSVKANGILRADAKTMGTALEWVMDSRAKTIGEIGDSYAGTRVEKLAQSATHAFTRLSLMATWNSSLKAIGAALEQHAIAKAIEGNVAKMATAKLAAHGIGEAELQRVQSQWAKYGTVEDGISRARTSLWDDQEAAKLVEVAVSRAADRVAAFNVGKGDLPHLMDNALWRTLLQFKSFGMASVNRIMIPVAQGLAHGDAAAANGLGLMLALGALTYYAKEWTSGREPDLSASRLAPEMLNWSGALGFLPDVYDPIANPLHLPRFSQYADRSIAETFAGPTAGTIDALLRAVGEVTPRGPWSPGPAPSQTGPRAQTVHQIRQLVPLQNHFLTARFFNALEGEADELLGVPGTPDQTFMERAMATTPPKAATH